MDYDNGSGSAAAYGTQGGQLTKAVHDRHTGLGTPRPPSNGPERATVGGCLDYQLSQLAELHAALNNLESCLALILSPPGPETLSKTASENPVALIDRVSQHSQIINLARARVSQLVDRLQV